MSRGRPTAGPRDCKAPRPGLEPGTPRSKRGMMSFSPPGHERKARDSNPHHATVSRLSKAVRPTVSGYLPVTEYAVLSEWTHWELNPDFQFAELASSRWTMGPSSVDRRGLEPRFPTCEAGVFPLD